MLAKEFNEMIDGKLPYADSERVRAYINEAVQIGPDAVYKIVEEICRVPVNVKVKQADLLSLIEAVDGAFEDSVKKLVLSIAKKMILNEQILKPEILDAMDTMANQEPRYNALNILYFAVDDDDGMIEKKYDSIVQSWS